MSSSPACCSKWYVMMAPTNATALLAVSVNTAGECSRSQAKKKKKESSWGLAVSAKNSGNQPLLHMALLLPCKCWFGCCCVLCSAGSHKSCCPLAAWLSGHLHPCSGAEVGGPGVAICTHRSSWWDLTRAGKAHLASGERSHHLLFFFCTLMSAYSCFRSFLL